MAQYALQLDRRTHFGKNFFNFLNEMNCIDAENPNVADVDERTADGKRIMQLLYAVGVVKKKDNDADIVNAVTKRFMLNRKKKGELDDKEIMMLNSQINASRYFAGKL